MSITGRDSKQYDQAVLDVRQPQYGADPIFINRWSTRAFAPYELSKEELYTILEAGQHAPSANNFQPWRFFIAQTEQEKAHFLSFILPRNAEWCKNASALILLASDTLTEDGKDNGKHAFDTGAAWQAIALQAHLLGLSTRAMGGFDSAAAREKLNIPQQLVPQIVIALGKPGSLEQLHPSFHDRNKPTPRKSLQELIIPYEIK